MTQSRRDELVEQIRKLADGKLTKAEVAKAVGISRNHLYRTISGEDLEDFKWANAGSRASKKRWANPEYRARMMPHLERMQPIATKAHQHKAATCMTPQERMDHHRLMHSGGYTSNEAFRVMGRHDLVRKRKKENHHGRQAEKTDDLSGEGSRQAAQRSGAPDQA